MNARIGRSGLVALLGVALVASACGLGSGDTSSGGPVTLRWFLRWDQARIDGVARPAVAAFHAQHPNITIQIENQPQIGDYWTKLQTELAGGTAPDVIYPNTQEAASLAGKQALLNLDPYTQRDAVDTSQYESATLNYYRSGGHLYGLPIDSARLAVFYNQDMLSAAGVATPQAGWTWDDFIADARSLARTVNGQKQYGTDDWVSGNPGYWPLMVWDYTGHDVFDDPHHPTKFLLNDPRAVANLQRLGDLINRDGAMPKPSGPASVTDLFVAGKAAMTITGHWKVPQYLANAKFHWGVIDLPTGSIQGNRNDGSAWSIPAQSKHAAEAWEFIRFLGAPGSTGVKQLLKLQQMTPALVPEQGSQDFLAAPAAVPSLDQRAFLAGSGHLFTLYNPLLPAWDQIDQIEATALDQVWTGRITAQQAVQQMEPQIDGVLKSGV